MSDNWTFSISVNLEILTNFKNIFWVLTKQTLNKHTQILLLHLQGLPHHNESCNIAFQQKILKQLKRIIELFKIVENSIKLYRIV